MMLIILRLEYLRLKSQHILSEWWQRVWFGRLRPPSRRFLHVVIMRHAILLFRWPLPFTKMWLSSPKNNIHCCFSLSQYLHNLSFDGYLFFLGLS